MGEYNYPCPGDDDFYDLPRTKPDEGRRLAVQRARLGRFVLWNPASDLPPTKVFDTRKDAEAAAEKMAANTTDTFYVVRMVSRSRRAAPPVTTERLKGGGK